MDRKTKLFSWALVGIICGLLGFSLGLYFSAESLRESKGVEGNFWAYLFLFFVYFVISALIIFVLSIVFRAIFIGSINRPVLRASLVWAASIAAVIISALFWFVLGEHSRELDQIKLLGGCMVEVTFIYVGLKLFYDK